MLILLFLYKQIVLEEDGTSINKFELLNKLSTLYPNSPLLLMLLVGDEKWQKEGFERDENTSSTTISGIFNKICQ